MDDILLLKRADIEEFSAALGFTQSLFMEDIEVVEEKDNSLRTIERSKKVVVFRPTTEKMLRLVLEKSKAEIIVGAEKIHAEDSLHYVRGGWDQILCTIAAAKGKTIVFSMNDILYAVDRPRLLARMRFNLKLCRKYKVKVLMANFAREKMEMRSKKDLEAWRRVLERG